MVSFLCCQNTHTMIIWVTFIWKILVLKYFVGRGNPRKFNARNVCCDIFGSLIFVVHLSPRNCFKDKQFPNYDVVQIFTSTAKRELMERENLLKWLFTFSSHAPTKINSSVSRCNFSGSEGNMSCKLYVPQSLAEALCMTNLALLKVRYLL